MKKIKIFILTTLLMSLFLSSAKADDNEENSSFFNPEIFSLSKKKESAFDAPSATYILSSEDIRRSGATSIPEVLRMVPGLQVARIDGNKWAITARGFNRQFSNKLLVMIDGRTVYTTLFSGVFWDIQDYVIEDIDRIEIVKGPGGTIWGSNAVNGVINVITKNAAQTQGVYVSQIFGNQDKSITEARYGKETASKNSYRLYFKKAVREGLDKYSDKQNNKDGIKQDRAGFRYDISSVKDSKISIHGNVFSGIANKYYSLNTPSQNNKNSHGGNLVANWNKKLSSKSTFILNSYFDYDQFKIPVLNRSAQTLDFDFQHFYDFSKDNQFIWGVGYRQIFDKINSNSVDGKTPLQYSNKYRNDQWFSSFIQDKIVLIPDKLHLTVGSKFEKNDFNGFSYQPNARLAYYPNRKQTIWASVSKSIRTPTRGESDVTIRDNSGLVLNQGSPNYGVEQLIAYETGYRIKPNSKTSIDVATFYNQYSKLRTFESDPAGPTAANLGYGESYGFEITGKFQVTNNWKLEANYDRLELNLHLKKGSTDNLTILKNSDNLENAEFQSPHNQFKIKSFYNIAPKIELDNILYYVDGLNKGVANESIAIPSYFRFDTRIGYLVTRNFDLSVGIQDVLNQTHTEFKKALYSNQTLVGRNFYGKIVWQY